MSRYAADTITASPPDDEGTRLLPFGTGVSQCGGCGKVFASVYAFDAHRVGAGDYRRCLTTEEMGARGMVLNARQRWVTEAYEREPR